MGHHSATCKLVKNELLTGGTTRAIHITKALGFKREKKAAAKSTVMDSAAGAAARSCGQGLRGCDRGCCGRGCGQGLWHASFLGSAIAICSGRLAMYRQGSVVSALQCGPELVIQPPRRT